MFATARLRTGIGAASLIGLFLSGSAASAGDPPSLPKQLSSLGQQAFERGQFGDAAGFYHKALQLDPANAAARAALADPALARIALRQDPPPPAPGIDAPAPAAAVPPSEAPQAAAAAPEVPPAHATLERASELEKIQSQRLQAQTRERVQHARDDLNAERTDKALTDLRLALSAIQADVQVPSSVRDALTREVQIEIQSAVKREEEILARQAERARLQQFAIQKARALSEEAVNQETVLAMMTRFDAAMGQGYYNVFYNGGLGDISAATAPFYDARILAQQARALELRALAPRAGVFVSQTVGFFAQAVMFDMVKEYRAMLTWQDVERAAIPFPDTITIEYPDAEFFRMITEKRRKKYESVDLAARDERTKAIQDVLSKPMAMPFPNETPLEDVLKYIKQSSDSPELPGGIPIYLDPIGLQEADKTETSTVKIDLEGVPLKKTLKLILEQLDLNYSVKDGMMRITSKESELQELETRVYPVGDLSMVPISLLSSGGGGMGGMGGGMGGMGGGMGGMGGGMGGMGGGMMGGMGGGMGGMRSVPVQNPAQANPFDEKKSR